MKPKLGRSVRKIRTVRELSDLLRIVPKSKPISIEILRQELVKARLHEVATYLGLLRRRRRSYPTFEDESSLLELAKDRIAFANTVGIWQARGGRISLTPKGQLLKRELDSGDSPVDVKLLQMVIESPYQSYQGFLENMARHGGLVRVAGKNLNRRKGARNLVHSSGFAMDVASFHTIKDLYYDFGFLNWRIFGRKETLYITRDLHKFTRIPFVKEIVQDLGDRLPEGEVSLSDFAKSIEHAFNALGLEKDVYQELLVVRDEVCQELRMSDQRFAKMVMELYGRATEESRIVLGVGALVEKPPIGYSKKLSSLPEIQGEEQLTKIMVRSFGV